MSRLWAILDVCRRLEDETAVQLGILALSTTCAFPKVHCSAVLELLLESVISFVSMTVEKNVCDPYLLWFTFAVCAASHFVARR